MSNKEAILQSNQPSLLHDTSSEGRDDVTSVEIHDEDWSVLVAIGLDPELTADPDYFEMTA